MKKTILKLLIQSVFLASLMFSFVETSSAVCVYNANSLTATCDGVPVTLPGSGIIQTTTALPTSVGIGASQYPEFCSALSRTFGIGDSGNDVKRLQVVLGQEGIAYVGATGYFGPVTQKAVKIFQQRNGIRQTGAVGPVTLARMRQLWCLNPGYCLRWCNRIFWSCYTKSS
jgi:ribosomal protein S28E/S33